MEIIINGKSYLLDMEKAQAQGLLKANDSIPHSWEDHVNKTNIENTYNSSIIDNEDEYSISYDDFKTEEEAKAFVALGRLINLRNDWVGNWKPDWNKLTEYKYCIISCGGEITTEAHCVGNSILAFPNAAIRDAFLETFEALIKQAKMFL